MDARARLTQTSPHYSEFMNSLTVGFLSVITYLIFTCRIYDLAEMNWSSVASGVLVKAKPLSSLICLKDNTSS